MVAPLAVLTEGVSNKIPLAKPNLLQELKFVRDALPSLAREVISIGIETDGQIWIGEPQSHTLQR
jgi:hypothetical protein